MLLETVLGSGEQRCLGVRVLQSVLFFLCPYLNLGGLGSCLSCWSWNGRAGSSFRGKLERRGSETGGEVWLSSKLNCCSHFAWIAAASNYSPSSFGSHRRKHLSQHCLSYSSQFPLVERRKKGGVGGEGKKKNNLWLNSSNRCQPRNACTVQHTKRRLL